MHCGSGTEEQLVDSKSEIFANGFWHNNAIFAQLLGMCPLLGVTTSAENGFWMGA
ncbi:MAG: Rnf-Nqr domain containing protein, partial [Mariprofundaceae bacterium]|nr:Rnf-Nqr domain containing protein [Mariprofundaceae bacterium]